MSLNAVMAYLRLLRERQNISQSQVARAAGVEPKQVYRWEKGESEPTASGLIVFVHAVKGRAVDIQKLMIDSDADENDGKELAETALKERERLSGFPDSIRDLRDRLVEIADQISNEDKLIKLVEYGELLLTT